MSQPTATPDDAQRIASHFQAHKRGPKKKNTQSTVRNAGLAPLKDAISRGAYTRPTTMDKPERMAHFIHWCSVQYPRLGVPYEWIMWVVDGLLKPPAKGSPELKVMIKKIGSVKKILLAGYNRYTFSKNGTIRLCVDANDELMHVGPKYDKALNSAAVRADTFHDHCPPSAVEITDANRAEVERQQRAAALVKEVLKQSQVALLPPAKSS